MEDVIAYRCLFSFSKGFFPILSRLILAAFKVEEGLRGEINWKKPGVLERIAWNVYEIKISKDSNYLFEKQLKLSSPVYMPGETLCQ